MDLLADILGPWLGNKTTCHSSKGMHSPDGKVAMENQLAGVLEPDTVKVHIG